MKAFDLMKAAYENPEKYEGKKYKVVRGSSLGDSDENIYECIVRDGRICKHNAHSILPIFADTQLKEIEPEPKPVSFMEAVNSGKRFKPESWHPGLSRYKDDDNEYRDLYDNLMMFEGRQMLNKEIINGLWLIEE